MDEIADRFGRIAEGFDRRVAGVTDWDAPAPCDGWFARDVVRHLVDWMSGMFASAGVVVEGAATVDDDPVAAWRALRDAFSARLNDPAAAIDTMEFGPAGTHTVAQAIDRFVTPDVLVHTWDLARASGQDDTLDAEVCASVLAGFAAMGDALVASGQFAAPVEVAAGASAQDRLVAASGRDPAWQPSAGDDRQGRHG